MRLKQCAACGKSFVASGRTIRLCPECTAASKKNVMRQRTCRQCGAVFEGGPRAWYCPACRYERKKARDRECKRNGPARPIGSIDRCVVCGAEYTVESGNQRYCPDCAAEAIKAADRAAALEYYTGHKEQFERRKKDHTTLCVICGKPVCSGTVSITCSPECAALVRKRHNQNADYKRGEASAPSAIKRLDDLLQADHDK